MKEYQSKPGGRYVFNEDIHNLEELALSAAEIFKDCGLNFVISGCEIEFSDNYVSVNHGYAFINGKICEVHSESLNISTSINNIALLFNTINGPSIVYANGSTDKQYIEYGAKFVINQNVNEITPHILATGSGTDWKFPNLRDAWFRHYCPITEPSPEWSEFDISSKFPNTTAGNAAKQEVAANFGQTTMSNGKMTVDNLPVFSLNDVIAMRRALINKLAVNDYAWINSARIENLKIGDLSLLQYIGNVSNIEHIRLIAKMRNNSSTGSAISTLKAIVTDYHLIIRGTLTRTQLDGQSIGSTSEIGDLNLYLPASVKNMLSLSYPTTAGDNNFSYDLTFYEAEYQLGNIYYMRATQYASGDGTTPYVAGEYNMHKPLIGILASGKLKLKTGRTTSSSNTPFGCYPHPVKTNQIEFAVTFDRVPATMPDDYSE